MLKFPISKSLNKKNAKQKGMASIEALLAIPLFVALVAFSLGFFGIVHTGIVNSIAARTYAFDTFENRTYLIYHRGSAGVGGSTPSSHRAKGYRLHAIVSENPGDQQEWIVTQRYLAFARDPDPTNSELNVARDSGHKAIQEERFGENILDRGGSRPRFNPVWVKAAYGICLDVQCGP